MRLSVPALSLSFLLIGVFHPTIFCAGDSPPLSSSTSPAERQEAWETHKRLARESPFRHLSWRVVGPAYQGGRIECIACPAGYTSTIYVGAGAGNLWKSENNGTTWKPIFENESTFAMGAVAVAPSNRDIIWAGTGEVLMARSSFAGTGLFKSQDGGETWTHRGLDDTHHIARIVIDPEDPDTVYVAAIGHNYTFNEERGLFKTIDGGKTWNKILYTSDRVGCVEVVPDPSDRNTLYAVLWERDRKAWNHVDCGEGSGLYKTDNGGRSWSRLAGGLPQGKHVGRIGVAVAPSKPSVLYALVDNHSPRPDGKRRMGGEVYRSDNGGEHWRKVHEKPLATRIGYDFCLIHVSPDDEDQIYVLGTYLLMSKDGGKTYERNQGRIVNLLPHEATMIHLDHHAFWIDPLNPDRVIDGTDGGLYMSYDRGKTWLRLNNLPIAEVYALTVDNADPYNVYIGTQDNAALYGPALHEVSDPYRYPWRHVYLDRWGGGDSYFTYVDPEDASTIYYEHQFGDLKRKNMAEGKTKSISPRGRKGEAPLRRNWMSPFLVSGHDPKTLYYGAQRLFKSTSRGDDWTCISPDLTTNPGPDRQRNVPYGTLTAISESPLKSGWLVVGTDDGNIQITTDDGRTWIKVSEKLPENWVSRVVASRHELGTIYVSLTGYREDDFKAYVYLSKDRGRSWHSIAGNLPSESINVIAEDPRDEEILYIGTDLGVYTSLDRGRTWHSLRCNLPTTPVHDLAVHPRELELVIGTHGRGVFVLDVKGIRKERRYN